jgi:succinyl-diaminopimelate desuccinylase
VVEFGLVNATIHQIDERVELADLYALREVYLAFLERFFEAR